MLLAFNPFGDIVEITAFSGSLYGACFLPTMLIGLRWKRGTATGALVCVMLGSVTVILGFILKKLGWMSWHEIFPGLLVGCLSYFGVSLMTSKSTRLVTID